MNIIFDLEQKGIYSSENLIDKSVLENLKEFDFKEDVKIYENIGKLAEIKHVSKTLHDFLEKQEIKDIEEIFWKITCMFFNSFLKIKSTIQKR